MGCVLSRRESLTIVSENPLSILLPSTTSAFRSRRLRYSGLAPQIVNHGAATSSRVCLFTSHQQLSPVLICLYQKNGQAELTSVVEWLNTKMVRANATPTRERSPIPLLTGLDVRRANIRRSRPTRYQQRFYTLCLRKKRAVCNSKRIFKIG